MSTPRHRLQALSATMRMHHRLALSLALALALAFALARPQPPALGTTGPRPALPAGLVGDTWREFLAFTQTYAPLPRVITYARDADFEAAARSRLPRVASWLAGFYVPGEVHLKVTGDPAADRRLLRHELAHALLGWRSDIPLWFQEGFAGYMATRRNHLPTRALVDWYRETGIYLPEAEIVGPHSAFCEGTRAAVEYLVATRGEPRLRELVRRLRQGERFPDAFQAVFGLSPTDLHCELWGGCAR